MENIFFIMTNMAVVICTICFGLICAALIGMRSLKVEMSDSIEQLTHHNEI
ncbi:hypothetical protein [Halodesulfovibrio sp.]|uniref:hypothetical protein n=1 Tax=Halodesulfovibrio sp. TaxID=1912772 RepID=UPI0025C39D94|nr:hypothetical protein [Halodesulfovibrio sp.]